MVDNLTCDEFWTLHRNRNKDKQLWIRFRQYINNGWGCSPLCFYPSVKTTYFAVKGSSIATVPSPHESEIQYKLQYETFNGDEDYTPDTDDITCSNIIDYDDDNSNYDEQDPFQDRKERICNKFIYQFYSEYLEQKLSHVQVHKNLCYPLSYYRYIDYKYIGGVYKDCQGCSIEYNNFPHNIKRVISIRRSTFDSKRWLLLGQLSTDKDNNGKYFFFKASCHEEGFEVGGVITLYICNDYNLLVNKAINDGDKFYLGLILSQTKKRLANMVYYKFVERLSKPPHGYYFLKDTQQQLLDSNSPHYEQFKLWVSNRDYKSIDEFLSL